MAQSKEELYELGFQQDEPPPPSNPGKRGLSANQSHQAQLRRRFAGQWVGWTPDFQEIVVNAATPEEAYAAGERSGVERLIYEYLPALPMGEP